MLPLAAARWIGVTPFCALSAAVQPSVSTSHTTTGRWPNREAGRWKRERNRDGNGGWESIYIGKGENDNADATTHCKL